MNQITELKIRPVFELEDFMNFSHESRLDNATLENLASLWDEWSDNLRSVQIKAGTESWLAVWLPEQVENEIDMAWHESPGKGFLLNSLAQYMCMAAVEEALPQTAGTGCAPTPRPDAELRAALTELNVTSPDGVVNKRFAVISYFPFRGGCEVCALNQNCPRGQDDFASIVLPGHER